MTNENDILSDYSETGSAGSKKFIKAVIVLYTLYNILYLLGFLLAIRFGKIDPKILFSSPLMLTQVLVVRLIPILALLLFICKKRAGWILIMLLSTIDLLYRGLFALNVALNFKTYMEVVPAYFMASMALIFLVSISVFILLFYKQVTDAFRITNRIKFISLISGIIIFFILRFYITPLLIRLLTASQ